MTRLADLLAQEFVQRALLGGLLAGLCAGFIGTWVLLRRLSLVAESLTHAMFPGIALSIGLFGITPLAIAVGQVVHGAEGGALDGDAGDLRDDGVAAGDERFVRVAGGEDPIVACAHAGHEVAGDPLAGHFHRADLHVGVHRGTGGVVAGEDVGSLHAAGHREALNRRRVRGFRGVEHASGKDLHVVQVEHLDRAEGLCGEGHAAGVGLHGERPELAGDIADELRGGGGVGRELAQGINRQPCGTGGVELSQIAIHAHLAEGHAERIELAEIDQAVPAGRSALGGEAEVRLGEAGPGGEVRIDEVRAAGQGVGRGEVKLRGGERALGALDRHQVAVPVGESRAPSASRHGHLGGAKAEDHVARAAIGAALVGVGRPDGEIAETVAIDVAIDVAGGADGKAGEVATHRADEFESIRAIEADEPHAGREAAGLAEDHVARTAVDAALIGKGGSDDHVGKAVSIHVSGTAQNMILSAGLNFGAGSTLSVGSVTINGSFLQSRIAIGAQYGADSKPGTADDVLNAASTLNKLIIKGAVFGTVGGSDYFGILAGKIASATLSGSKIALAPGAQNLNVALSSDVFVKDAA